MLVKRGEGKILNIVDEKDVNVDDKKVHKAINKQKKIAKTKEDIKK